MNKEDTKKCIAVMQAYVDGCEIYYCDIPSGKPVWNWDNFIGKYKIVPKPKYRPFTAVELVNHFGRSLYSKMNISFETLFNDYVFADGSPCGALVEEDNES